MSWLFGGNPAQVKFDEAIGELDGVRAAPLTVAAEGGQAGTRSMTMIEEKGTRCDEQTTATQGLSELRL